MELSHLIDQTAKNYLYETLQNCHSHRVTIYYYVLNIGVFLIFASIAGYTLYYCYTHRLSDREKHEKMKRDQAYVLSKIRYYQEESKERKTSSITKLPSLGQTFF